MIKAAPTLVILVAISFLTSTQSSGQTPPPSTDCQKIAELTVAIHELVSELRNSSERESRHQDLLVAIEYLQFRSRSIESLEEEVRQTQDQRERSVDILDRSKANVNDLEKDLDNATGEEAKEKRSMIERFERNLASFEASIDRYDRKIIDLENQIIQSRRQLLSLEEYVIENLNLEP